jgi:hypothetical protein
LPDDLEFEGLIPSQDEGIIRIRFSRASRTKLDLPLSERVLADLVSSDVIRSSWVSAGQDI